MNKPFDYKTFVEAAGGVPEPVNTQLANLQKLLVAPVAAELANETDFDDVSLESVGAGRQSTPSTERYSARARTRLLVTMARDLLRAEQLLAANYDSYRANLLGSIVDRTSALVAVESFTPAMSLQFPLTYASLRLLFAALIRRVVQFGVPAPSEWSSFADGSYDPADEMTASTPSS